jgi:hypothetical protein
MQPAATDPRLYEMLSALLVRFDGLDERLSRLTPRKRQVSPTTRAQHRLVLEARRWNCPCCSLVRDPAAFEIDHWRDVERADFAHTWAICRDCHRGITHGALKRDEVEASFRAYHEHARRQVLPLQHSLWRQ